MKHERSLQINFFGKKSVISATRYQLTSKEEKKDHHTTILILKNIFN